MTTPDLLPGVPTLDPEPPEDRLPLAEDSEAPPERKRRRRHRGKVEEPPPPSAPVVSEEELAKAGAAFGLAFRVVALALASKRGTHWKLAEEEERALGSAWAVALAPYLPKIGPAVPFAAAVAVTWATVAGRLEHDRELAAAAVPELVP